MIDSDDKMTQYGFILVCTTEEGRLYVNTPDRGDQLTWDINSAWVFPGTAQRDGETKLNQLGLDAGHWKTWNVKHGYRQVTVWSRTVTYQQDQNKGLV